MLSVNASRALWRETLSRRRIHYIKVREAIREGQTPCVSFHGQKVLGCGFMHVGTTVLTVGKAAAESEAGEHDAGGTIESQARKTGWVYSQDTCSLVPPLTPGLLGSDLEGGPSGGGAASLSPSRPEGGSSFLPLITGGLSHAPPFCSFWFFPLLSSM